MRLQHPKRKEGWYRSKDKYLHFWYGYHGYDDSQRTWLCESTLKRRSRAIKRDPDLTDMIASGYIFYVLKYEEKALKGAEICPHCEKIITTQPAFVKALVIRRMKGLET